MENKAIFDDLANEYDAWFDTPVGKKVKQFELDLLLSSINPLKKSAGYKGIKMLEVGIGTGLFAAEFRKVGVSVVGIDPSQKMLEIARKRGFDVQYGIGEDIPFPDDAFDVVLAMTSLEFSKKPLLFVNEMKRVAKQGGTVAIAVLNLWSLYGIARRIKGIFKRNFFNDAHFYTYCELKNLLSKKLKEVNVSSSVFFNDSTQKWLLDKSDSLEKFGRRHLKSFGALLVGSSKK